MWPESTILVVVIALMPRSCSGAPAPEASIDAIANAVAARLEPRLARIERAIARADRPDLGVSRVAADDAPRGSHDKHTDRSRGIGLIADHEQTTTTSKSALAAIAEHLYPHCFSLSEAKASNYLLFTHGK